MSLELSIFFTNYVIFLKLCDQMRFEAKFVKSHHCIILEGLYCKYLFKAPGRGGGAYFFQALLRGSYLI